MKIPCTLFNFPHTIDRAFCIVFSSQVKKINDVTSDQTGIFELKAHHLKNNQLSFEVDARTAFQALLLIQTEDKDYISNLYLCGDHIAQSPYLFIKSQADNTLDLDWFPRDSTQTLIIQSAMDPEKQTHPNEWVFGPIPDSLTIPQTEGEILCTLRTQEGFDTSYPLHLGQQNLKTKGFYRPIKLMPLIQDHLDKNILSIKVSKLAPRMCVLGGIRSTADTYVIHPHKKTLHISYFGDQPIDVEAQIEIDYLEKNELKKIEIPLPLKMREPGDYSYKECIRCENKLNCKIMEAMKYITPTTPWLKFITG